jgi:serine/threonine protein kinase
MPAFNEHRGTEQDVLEELKILAESDHDHILRYYHSWSEPSEYHKGRDRILFHPSDISGFMMSTTGDNQTQSGDSALDVSRGPDDNRTQLGTTRWNTSSRPDDLDAIIAFESSQKDKSSSNNRSMPSTDDASSSNNRSIPSTDDVSSSEKEGQNKSEPYEYLFIVTSLCNPKSLADHLLPEYRSKNKITRFDALYIFYQIVEGVRYLHDNMNVVTLYSYLSS